MKVVNKVVMKAIKGGLGQLKHSLVHSDEPKIPKILK